MCIHCVNCSYAMIKSLVHPLTESECRHHHKYIRPGLFRPKVILNQHDSIHQRCIQNRLDLSLPWSRQPTLAVVPLKATRWLPNFNAPTSNSAGIIDTISSHFSTTMNTLFLGQILMNNAENARAAQGGFDTPL